MGKSQRNKGHMWERQIARDLHVVDPTAKRNLEYQEGGTRDIVTRLPFKTGQEPESPYLSPGN
jgi:hypothetical protein